MLSNTRDHTSIALGHAGIARRDSGYNPALMIIKRRPFPPGVTVRQPLDMARFLPYRIHWLAARISEPPPVTLKDGTMIRARDWRVLACLGGFGPLTNTEISHVVGLDAATITRAVQYLQENDLVMSRSLPTDGRKQIVSLTAAGAAAHDQIAPARRAKIAEIEKFLSAKDRDELFRILDRIDEALEKLEEEDPKDLWNESPRRKRKPR